MTQAPASPLAHISGRTLADSLRRARVMLGMLGHKTKGLTIAEFEDMLAHLDEAARRLDGDAQGRVVGEGRT